MTYGNSTTADVESNLTFDGNTLTTDALIIDGGGTYAAGSIYSDSNWGMLFRAKQASPSQAEFRWADSADSELMRIDTSGNLELPNDLQAIEFGAGKDGRIYSYNDDLYIVNQTAGQDTIFRNLNSAGSSYVTNLFIDGSAERVGIGTNSPAYKLQVSGGDIGIDVGERLYFGGSNHTYISEDIDDRLRFFVGGAEMFRLNEINDFASFFTDVTLAATDKLFFDGGSHTYITETANDLLDVYVGGTNLLRLEESGTDSVFTTDNTHLAVGTHKDLRIYHNSSSTNNNIENHNGSLYITNEVDNTDIIFRNDDGSGGVTAYLTLDGDTTHLLLSPPGNVGIGTNSPSAKLDVNGQARSTNGMLVNNGTTAGFFTTDSDNVNFGASTSGKGLKLFTANAEQMRITSAGRVLIGGTSASGHNYDFEVLDNHAFVKGPDGWNGTGDLAIVALGSAVVNEVFGCGYKYGTGMILSTYKTGGYGSFGSSCQDSLIIADTTGQAKFINDVVAFATSDKRLKENVKPLDSALDKINKINGVEFDWIDGKDKHGNSVHSNEGHDIGVIAQEIEEVLPEVVTTRDNGYKAVKYEKIVPLLIQAIKEQQKQIEELKNG